jgi:hypothetical protein
MIAKISPVFASAHQKPHGRGRTTPGAGVSRIRLEVEVDLAPQGTDVSPDGQPPTYTQTARQAKIAALKSAVGNGTYNISAEQIADRLLTATLVDLLA